MAAESMTDFDYDPIPLDPPEVLAPEAILNGALAYRDRLARRRTVRDFSDEPIDRAVIEACVLGAEPAASTQASITARSMGSSEKSRTVRRLASRSR